MPAYDPRYYNIPVEAPPGFRPDKPFGYDPNYEPPKTYLWLSILAIIAFFPLGIPAIICSILCSKERAKSYESSLAKRTSYGALLFSIIAIVIGICFWVTLAETCLISNYQMFPKLCRWNIGEYYEDYINRPRS